jgi:hypothetical protein
MYICDGEEVTVSWELFPVDTEGRPLGLEILVAWALLTGDVVAPGTPENIFAGGLVTIPDVNMGSRTFSPTSDRAFFFDATVEGFSPLSRERRDVRVVEDGGVRLRFETFQFGCTTGSGGGPGWSKAFYERGQLASARLPIMQVQNRSGEEIRLTVERERSDEMLPPWIMSAVIPAGEVTDVFNGEYYGIWAAVPTGLTLGTSETICDTPPSEPLFGLPPAPTPEERVSDIRIGVAFGCVEAVPDEVTGGEMDDAADGTTDSPAGDGTDDAAGGTTDGESDDKANDGGNGNANDDPNNDPNGNVNNDPNNGANNGQN